MVQGISDPDTRSLRSGAPNGRVPRGSRSQSGEKGRWSGQPDCSPATLILARCTTRRARFAPCLITQRPHPGGDVLNSPQHPVERPGQVERDHVEALASVPHAVRRRVRLSLRINEEPAREVERGGVGQQLIQVGVGHGRIGQVLVLGVAHEGADRAVPPRQVGRESNLLLPRRV